MQLIELDLFNLGPFFGSEIHSLNELPGGNASLLDREGTEPRQDRLDVVRKHDSLSQLSECDGAADEKAPERIMGVSLGSDNTLIDNGSSSSTSGRDKVEHELAWR